MDERLLSLTEAQLKEDVTQGNVGMVLEHMADAKLSDQELKDTLAQALNVRADQKDNEAIIVDKSWGEKGKGSFERNRAINLRRLAEQIKNL